MMFDIDFLPAASNEPSNPARDTRDGRIVVGSFTERFIASLAFWQEHQYVSHWTDQIERVVAGSATAALITSMYDPLKANFITWWPIYRIGDLGYIRNQLLFLDRLDTPFDPTIAHEYVRERQIVSDDGQKISEWQVSIQ